MTTRVRLLCLVPTLCLLATSAGAVDFVYRAEGVFTSNSVLTPGLIGQPYVLVVTIDEAMVGSPLGGGTLFSGGLLDLWVDGALILDGLAALVSQDCCGAGTFQLAWFDGIGDQFSAFFEGFVFPDASQLTDPALLVGQQGATGRIDEFDDAVNFQDLASAVLTSTSVLHYDFDETGNAPGSRGTDRRPVKTRNDASTALDFHTADGGGVSGLSGDRAFANTGPSNHGQLASGASNGFRADQGDNAAIDGLAAFTISGWFKTETIASLLSATPRMVNNHDGGAGAAGDGFNLQFFTGSDGDLKLEIDDDTGGGVNTTGTPYSAKQKWVFFAVSYDGDETTDNVQFYRGFRNDAEAGGGPGSAEVSLLSTHSLDRGPVDDESVGLHLGNRPGSDRPFDGFLDEIRIDAAALTGTTGLATLESYRELAVAGPLDDSLGWVDSASVATSVLDQNATPVSVDELSGVTFDPNADMFWAVADSGGRLLELDVAFAADASMTSASATSALTLADVLDFEGVACTNAIDDSVFISDETNPGVREYDLATGSFLSSATVPALFSSSLRFNRGFEGLSRSPDGSSMIAALEQALTVDGPAGTSTTVPTVSRWQAYSTAPNPVLAEQYAYEVEPVHGTTGGGLSSSLGDLLILPDSNILVLERSDADGETLVRIFRADLNNATDVSVGSLAAGLIGESYIPMQKTLLFSDDRLGKAEGLGLGPKLASGHYALLVVEDANLSNVIRSFDYKPVPEPGALLQLLAGSAWLWILRKRRTRPTS